MRPRAGPTALPGRCECHLRAVVPPSRGRCTYRVVVQVPRVAIPPLRRHAGVRARVRARIRMPGPRPGSPRRWGPGSLRALALGPQHPPGRGECHLRAVVPPSRGRCTYRVVVQVPRERVHRYRDVSAGPGTAHPPCALLVPPIARRTDRVAPPAPDLLDTTRDTGVTQPGEYRACASKARSTLRGIALAVLVPDAPRGCRRRRDRPEAVDHAVRRRPSFGCACASKANEHRYREDRLPC